MSSLPIEGTISAKPFSNLAALISAPVNRAGATISAEGSDSPENSAVAELSTLIASLGTLSAQAQTLPLSPPTLPGLPQGGYQAQATDYMQLAEDAD